MRQGLLPQARDEGVPPPRVLSLQYHDPLSNGEGDEMRDNFVGNNRGNSALEAHQTLPNLPLCGQFFVFLSLAPLQIDLPRLFRLHRNLLAYSCKESNVATLQEFCSLEISTNT